MLKRGRTGAVDTTLWTGAAAAALLLGTLISGALQFEQVRDNLNRQAALARAAAAQHDLLLDLVNEETGVLGYAATGDPAYVTIYRRGRTAWARDAATAANLSGTMPVLTGRIERSFSVTEQIQRHLSDEIELIAAHKTAAAKADISSEKILSDGLRTLDDQIQGQVDAELAAQRESTRARVKAALNAAVGLCVIVVLWLIAFVFLLRRAAGYQRSSLRDPLTGVYNRRGAVAGIDAQIAARANGTFGVIFLDLDGFKKINDVYGHTTGDRILRSVAGRLQHELRPEDGIGRLGGDEFICTIAPPAPLDEVRAVAARLRRALAKPYTFADDMYAVGCSLGIAMYPQHGRTAEALLARADRAMYEAKSAGGGVREARAES